ncbi:MAG: TolC family protein [Chitinophagaceae bacterium]|nr:TolC family protein [Chitinophagaceae bacterium]
MKKILVVLLGFCCLQVAAQPRLSLTDAINTALKNSYDIQLAKNNLEIANTNNNIGIAGGLPTVTGTANDQEQITTINQAYTDASRDTKRSNVGANNLTVGVTGSMVLFNGWRVVATKKRLEELEKLNQQLLNAQIQNTIAGVMAKYYDVVRQQTYRQTIMQSIDLSKQRLDLIQVRKDVGLANNADLFQAQLDLNALVQSLQNQDLVIGQAKTDLQSLIFVQPDTTIILTDTVITIDPAISLDEIRAGIKNNPQLIAAGMQVNINELIERETAAQRYPTVRATTGYNFVSSKSAAGFSLLNQSYGPFLGLNVSVPIYNGGVFKRQQKVAEINTRNAAIARDNIYFDFENSAMRSYQAYINALQQLKTEQQNYDLSKQLVNIVLERFKQGVGTIVDVKLAQQTFENEGYRLVNLNYAAKAAEIELRRVSGKLAPQQ